MYWNVSRFSFRTNLNRLVVVWHDSFSGLLLFWATCGVALAWRFSSHVFYIQFLRLRQAVPDIALYTYIYIFISGYHDQQIWQWESDIYSHDKQQHFKYRRRSAIYPSSVIFISRQIHSNPPTFSGATGNDGKDTWFQWLEGWTGYVGGPRCLHDRFKLTCGITFFVGTRNLDDPRFTVGLISDFRNLEKGICFFWCEFASRYIVIFNHGYHGFKMVESATERNMSESHSTSNF